MATKAAFRAPADLIEEAEAAAKAAASFVGPAAILGTWNACNSATRSVIRVVIAASGPGITVNVFGACSPTPCDWGVVAGLAYAQDISSTTDIAFSAQYQFDFVETLVTGVLDSGSLRVETFNHFTDGSGRSDYYSKDYLCKSRR